MIKFNHTKLGNIQVLIDIEHCDNYISTNKHIALAKCYKVPYESHYSGHVQFQSKIDRVGKLKPEYYLLWGNTEDLNERGITHITNPSGRPVTERTAMKWLRTAHNATGSITFNKK